jgi:hypothetical protein
VTTWLSKLQACLDVLGGARPAGPPTVWRAIGWGLWWTFLLAITLFTAGRATKFIYVDF